MQKTKNQKNEEKNTMTFLMFTSIKIETLNELNTERSYIHCLFRNCHSNLSGISVKSGSLSAFDSGSLTLVAGCICRRCGPIRRPFYKECYSNEIPFRSTPPQFCMKD